MEKLKDIISGLKNTKVYVAFATNSVNLIPDIEKTDAPWRIWIDPPWRFLEHKVPVMSSMDCPWYGDFPSESEYRASFESWCGRIGPPSKVIQRSCVQQAPHDLVIEFEDGTELQVFVSEPEEESWYYCDRISGKYLIVSGRGIKEEAHEQPPSTGVCIPD